MKNKKANKIRSLLLNKINNEILSIFKREPHMMRINGYNIKELYNFNCENFEVCIINKTIIGSQIMNSSRKSKNYSTLHLDIIPINLLEKLEGENEDNLIVNSKKLLSYQKIKDPKIPSFNLKKKEVMNFYENQELINENKRMKDGFKTMRKILHCLKNKSNITFKDLKTPRNISNNPFTNILPKRKSYKHKSTKIISSQNKRDFKIELINMSYDDNNLTSKKEIEKNKVNSILKKENINLNLTKNNHPTFSTYIKQNSNNSKKKKISLRKKYSLNNFEFKKNRNYDKFDEPKTERPKITTLTLQDDSF